MLYFPLNSHNLTTDALVTLTISKFVVYLVPVFLSYNADKIQIKFNLFTHLINWM